MSSISPIASITVAKTPPASEPIFKPDLVRRMLLSIFGGTWKAGDRLREEKLAEFFQVSRTPIREALQELAAVGLVELRPNCGALVASFGPRQIEEIYEVRALLEAEATSLACESIAAEELQQLHEEHADLLSAPSRSATWSQRTWQADRHLHGLIADRCPNRRLAREITRYETFVQMVRETVGNRNQFQEAALREHQTIIAALRKRDAAKAGEAMRTHILNAGQIAVNSIRPILAPTKPTAATSKSGKAT